MGLSYLALGDSYTIGEGVAEQGRWPTQLAAALRDQGIALDDPRIIAATGWTTDELSAAIDAAEPLGVWQFVSLLIGVNNQYRGRSVEDYRREFEQLLQRAIQLAADRAERVLVLSIPDWGVSRYGQASGRDVAQIASELDAYNATAASLCTHAGIAFVDITPLSRDYGLDPDMLSEDGLHPSAQMYQYWAKRAIATAHRLLQPNSNA